MESNRAKHRVVRGWRRGRESGITVIGLLLTIVVVGTLGLAVIKIVPMYMERMKIGTILADVQDELAPGGNSVTSIRNALEARLNIDYIVIDRDEVAIERQGEGYAIHIEKELRAPFFADLWFLLPIDEQVQISR